MSDLENSKEHKTNKRKVLLVLTIGLIIGFALGMAITIHNTNQLIEKYSSDNSELCGLLNSQTDLTNTCIQIMNNITGETVSYAEYYSSCKVTLP